SMIAPVIKRPAITPARIENIPAAKRTNSTAKRKAAAGFFLVADASIRALPSFVAFVAYSSKKQRRRSPGYYSRRAQMLYAGIRLERDVLVVRVAGDVPLRAARVDRRRAGLRVAATVAAETRRLGRLRLNRDAVRRGDDLRELFRERLGN